jgi:hypothetical protein
MVVSPYSLVIAIALSLEILSCGCAAQHQAATIPAGANVTKANPTNTIPAGPSMVMPGAKHVAGQP